MQYVFALVRAVMRVIANLLKKDLNRHRMDAALEYLTPEQAEQRITGQPRVAAKTGGRSYSPVLAPIKLEFGRQRVDDIGR